MSQTTRQFNVDGQFGDIDNSKTAMALARSLLDTLAKSHAPDDICAECMSGFDPLMAENPRDDVRRHLVEQVTIAAAQTAATDPDSEWTHTAATHELTKHYRETFFRSCGPDYRCLRCVTADRDERDEHDERDESADPTAWTGDDAVFADDG